MNAPRHPVTVALSVQPPETDVNTTRDQVVQMISVGIHSKRQELVAWIRGVDPTAEVAELPDRTIDPVLDVFTTLEVVELLQSDSRPDCVERAFTSSDLVEPAKEEVQ